MWTWLGSNSAQIQALAGLLALIVAAAVGVVAFLQMRAANAQAKAAVDQTTAASEQAAAAREQVTAAKQQTATSLAIADKQTLPNLSITPAVNSVGQSIQGSIAILNNGSGPAFNVTVHYRDGNVGYDNLGVSGETIVVHDSVRINVDEKRAAQSGLKINYTTTFGTKYVLDFSWNGLIKQAVYITLYTEK
jgi:hypothetical protein